MNKQYHPLWPIHIVTLWAPLHFVHSVNFLNLALSCSYLSIALPVTIMKFTPFQVSVAYNYSCIVALKNFSFIVKTHQNLIMLASLLISLHRSSTLQRPSVFIRFILKTKFGETISNSTITLIERLLHWVMSIFKIVQCWQMSSKLTLDIGDLDKYNPLKSLLWTLLQGYAGLLEILY